MHIGIAGNIGCGKTTLTRMLAEHYGWKPKFEAVTYNPYLEDYYKDIERWSYNLETYFLAQRFQDLLDIAKSDDVIVQDRTILEGVHIFVANNKAMGNLSERDFDTYMQLFNLMMSMVREPDFAHLPQDICTDIGFTNPEARKRLRKEHKHRISQQP